MTVVVKSEDGLELMLVEDAWWEKIVPGQYTWESRPIEIINRFYDVRINMSVGRTDVGLSVKS